MTDREMHKLKRHEMLEIMLEQEVLIEQGKKDYDKLEKEYQNIKYNNDHLISRLDEKDVTIEGLKQKLNDKDKTIEGLKDRLNDKDNTIAGLISKLDEKDEEIFALRKEADQLKEKFSDMQSQLQDVKDKLIEMSNEMLKLVQSNKELEAIPAVIKKELDEQKLNNIKLENEITSQKMLYQIESERLKESINEKDKRIRRLESQIRKPKGLFNR